METTCRKCQMLFLRIKKKKITNLSSAEFSHRVVMVKVLPLFKIMIQCYHSLMFSMMVKNFSRWHMPKYFCDLFPEKRLKRYFTWIVKAYFLVRKMFQIVICWHFKHYKITIQCYHSSKSWFRHPWYYLNTGPACSDSAFFASTSILWTNRADHKWMVFFFNFFFFQPIHVNCLLVITGCDFF